MKGQCGRAPTVPLLGLPEFVVLAVVEVGRPGRTLRAWRVEFLAYFDGGGASNGPTEPIKLVIENHRERVVGAG